MKGDLFGLTNFCLEFLTRVNRTEFNLFYYEWSRLIITRDTEKNVCVVFKVFFDEAVSSMGLWASSSPSTNSRKHN